VIPYRINGSFVEIEMPRTYPTPVLRELYQTLLSDPAVPQGALLLVDLSHRTEMPWTGEVQARLKMFFELLFPKFLPVCAVVISPQTVLPLQTAQQLARVAGLRMGIFPDLHSARRWLGVYSRADTEPYDDRPAIRST
jgi:hypothetical protein